MEGAKDCRSREETHDIQRTCHFRHAFENARGLVRDSDSCVLASPLLPDLSLVSPGLTRATLVAGRPNKTFREVMALLLIFSRSHETVTNGH